MSFYSKCTVREREREFVKTVFSVLKLKLELSARYSLEPKTSVYGIYDTNKGNDFSRKVVRNSLFC